jgi:tetratricopeptide (TPR) repeat protein
VTFGGVVKYALGNYPTAHEFFLEGLQLMEKTGVDPWTEGICLSNLGLIAQVMGRYAEAYEKLRASVTASRESGDPRLIALTINLLTPIAIRLENYEEARDLIHESLELNEIIGDRWGLGTAYRNLGLLAQMQNKHARAQVAFRRSLVFFGELGAQWDIARTLADLGRSKLALDKDLEAERDLHDALRILVEIKGMPAALDALESIASLRAKQGHIEQAYEIVEVILHHKATLEETRTRAEKLCGELKAHLTPAQVEATCTSTIEKAIAAVLN